MTDSHLPASAAVFHVPVPTLPKVQRWMAFMGWRGNAATGFEWKRDADNNVIARRHDATWHADYEEAMRRAAAEVMP